MLGLRLTEGIELKQLQHLLAAGNARRAGAIKRHEQAGLLQRRDNHLRLTRRGLLLADTVLADLI